MIDVKALKDNMGEDAMRIIAAGIPIDRWNERKKEGLCPFHNEKTPSFKWNPKSNSFKCFGCGRTLDIIDYYMLFEHKTFFEAVEAIGGEVDRDEYRPKPSTQHKQYDKPKYSIGSDRMAVEAYMQTRGISKQTLDHAGVKQDDKGNIIFEYKNLLGEVEMVKYRPARKVQKGENKMWAAPNGRPLLYGMHQVDTTKPVLICEGEIDRLAAIEAGYSNAVSVPNGAGGLVWIEENWPWLEQIEQFVLWFDNDPAGLKGLREVIPRLGEAKCSVVKNAGGSKDINIQLYKHGAESVLKLIESAEPVPLDGVISLADVERYNVYDAPKIKSNIAGLDAQIGGFILGTVDIVTGINSSGKSTFINQVMVCEAINQGYKTFIFSGEMPDHQLKAWLEYPIAGPQYVEAYDRGEHQPKGYRVSKEAQAQMQDWYRDKIYLCQLQDVTASALLELMANVARRYGVKNFILDNLMMIDLECGPYDELKKQKEFVKALKDLASRYGAVVHLVAHPRKTDKGQRLTKQDIAGSGDITNLADYVIAIHRVSKADREPVKDGRGKVIKEGETCDCIVDLFKNRPLGYQDKEVRLNFDYPSKRFYTPGSNANWTYNWQVPDWVSEAEQLEPELF